MTCAMWNVTSMVCKTRQIMEHLMDRNPSIVFLTEIWLKSDKNEVKSCDYVLVHNRRKYREKERGWWWWCAT